MGTVAEAELQNLVRPRLLALIEGSTTRMELATAQWTNNEERITADASPRAFQAATAAYRSLVDLHADLGLGERAADLTGAETNRVRDTLGLVEDAIQALRAEAP
jgi:hypothetical protein